MKTSLSPIPPSSVFTHTHTQSNTKYVLKFLQQPHFARESTKSKRLLHPYPILCLKVYIKTNNGLWKDVTHNLLSQFFLMASIIQTGEFYNDEEEDVESSINHNDKPDYEFSELFLKGNKTISGSFYSVDEKPSLKIPSNINNVINSDNDKMVYHSIEELANEVGYKNIEHSYGNIVFIFNDLGIFKKGKFKLRFDLFKLEYFNHLIKKRFVKKIDHINGIYSQEFKVYGSRQFYNKINQAKFRQLLATIELSQVHDEVLNYLKKLKILKDSSNLIEKSNELNINNNKDNSNNKTNNNHSHNATVPIITNIPIQTIPIYIAPDYPRVIDPVIPMPTAPAAALPRIRDERVSKRSKFNPHDQRMSIQRLLSS